MPILRRLTPPNLSVYRDRPVRNRNGVLFRATLAATLLLAGCDKPEPGRRFTPQTPLRIAFVGPETPSERWDFIARGALTHARRHGSIELQVLPAAAIQPDGRLSGDSPQPDALIVSCTAPERQGPALLQAVSHYGVIITVGAQVPGVWGHIQFPAAEASELIARRLPDLLGERRTYVLLHTEGRDGLSDQALRRFEYAARRNYGLRQLAAVNLTQPPRPALECLEGLRTEFPSAAFAVILDSESVLMGDPRDWQARGLPFVTLGATPGLWPWVEAGLCRGMTGVVAGDLGRAAVQMAIEAHTPDARPGDFRTVAAEWVDATNLADFSRRFSDAVGLEAGDLRRPAPLLPRP
jgi:hypothetical protein